MERTKGKSAEEIRIDVINEAFGNGMRVENITPEMQLAQWLVVGLKRLGEGRAINPEDIIRIDKMGGTDHPDPYVGRL
jgi:hypothetical protein